MASTLARYRTISGTIYCETGLRIGQSVLHPKFGAGVIIDCEGNGSDARVQVNFGPEGVKWLMLEYAKLSPA